MSKLISNTSFGQLCKSKEKEFKTRLEYLDWYERKRDSYDDFLKQPLTLGMFIPCDEKGQPLSIHKGEEIDSSYPIEFIQAKERVIFGGIEVQNTEDFIEFYGGIRVFKKTNDFEKMFNYVFRKDTETKTLEDLIKYDLTLTETTAKKLGL